MLDLTIGTYRLQRRTEYSKFQVFNRDGDNISSTSFGEKMVEDYLKQKANPNRYFYIENGTLADALSELNDDDINFVFIPDNVTKLKENSFFKLNMEYVHLPNALNKLDNEVFYMCAKLKEITFPSSLPSLGENCFYTCRGLEYVKLPNLTHLPKSAFNVCQNLKEIELPDGLLSIDSSCFNYCESLKRIIIPDTVTEIGEDAFGACKSLEYIKLPKNLKVISNVMFAQCESLKEITLPDTITTIKQQAFGGAKSLTNITIPRGLNTIGWKPFGNSGVSEIIFRYDLKNLSGSEPYGAPNNLIAGSNITKLVIDKAVKTITPVAIGSSGCQITKIDYLGTKEEYKNFRKNNKELFERLPNIEKVSFVRDKPRDLSIER